MTVKEIANVAGTNERWTREIVKKTFPELVKSGKKTILNEEESNLIMAKLKKTNMVGNYQPDNMVGNYQLDEIISKTVKATIEAIMPVIHTIIKTTYEKISQVKQPEQKQITQPKDKAAYIGEKIAEQIRAKNERKQQANKTQLFLFEVGE